MDQSMRSIRRCPFRIHFSLGESYLKRQNSRFAGVIEIGFLRFINLVIRTLLYFNYLPSLWHFHSLAEINLLQKINSSGNLTAINRKEKHWRLRWIVLLPKL